MAESVRDTLPELIPAGGYPVERYINAVRITPALLLQENGYTELGSDQWRRPGAQTGARTLKLATQLDRPGINVFSGEDPVFSRIKDDGNVGRFCSVDDMFVLRTEHSVVTSRTLRGTNERTFQSLILSLATTKFPQPPQRT